MKLFWKQPYKTLKPNYMAKFICEAGESGLGIYSSKNNRKKNHILTADAQICFQKFNKMILASLSYYAWLIWALKLTITIKHRAVNVVQMDVAELNVLFLCVYVNCCVEPQEFLTLLISLFNPFDS